MKAPGKPPAAPLRPTQVGSPHEPRPEHTIDPHTPLRFDHLLHLLTSFALCMAVASSSPGQP